MAMGIIVRIAKGTVNGAHRTKSFGGGSCWGCALTVGAVASATGGIRNGGLIERDCK